MWHWQGLWNSVQLYIYIYNNYNTINNNINTINNNINIGLGE